MVVLLGLMIVCDYEIYGFCGYVDLLVDMFMWIW